MNKALTILASGVLASAVLTGCATQMPREDAGVLIGGVVGGILGSQIGGGRGQVAATIIGSVAGMAIGGAIGRTMDDVDRMNMAASLEATRTGVATEWRNPDSGTRYTMTPTQTIERPEGPCREFTLDAQIGGKTEQVYGTACRNPDGSWRIIN